MELEIGQNVMQLVEKLTVMLGTTASDIYPYFISKNYVDGMIMLLFPLLVMFVSFIIFVNYFKKIDDFDEVPVDTGIACIFSGFIFVSSTLVFFANFSESLNKIINPNSYAIKEIIEMMRYLK